MDRRIEVARGIIEREYDRVLRVGELAKPAGLSRPHLEMVFKQETGLTVKVYQREARLRRAVELLSKGHVSVKEAAFSVGYRSASDFTRDFRRRFGKAPSEVRVVLAGIALGRSQDRRGYRPKAMTPGT